MHSNKYLQGGSAWKEEGIEIKLILFVSRIFHTCGKLCSHFV